MSLLRSEIAGRVFNTPLLMHEGKAQAALMAVGGRIVDGGVTFSGPLAPIEHVAFENGRPSLGRLGDGLGRAFDSRGLVPFDVVDGVAVIPIEGTLVHKGAFVGMSSGRTSYQGLQTQISRAGRSEAVKGILFEVDSFGGETSGAFDTADLIAEVSKTKPTLAVLTDFALSGGYLLAAAAQQIVAPPDGKAGSIGAIRIHLDLSAKLEQEGIKVTILAAGKHKADGTAFAPLAEDLAKKAMVELEELRVRFAETVSATRGDRFSVEAAMETEADVFGAREAKKLGMIDAIGKPSEAFDAFVREVNRTARSSKGD